MQQNPKGAMAGGLVGLALVAVLLIILGTSVAAMLPIAVAAVFLVGLLVRESRG